MQSIYKEILPWTFFEQEEDDYCLVASSQEFIYYYTKEKISQDEIAREEEFDPEKGTKPINALNYINKILMNKNIPIQFYYNKLSMGFAQGSKRKKLKELNYFQEQIKTSIENKDPVLMSINGKYPWWQDLDDEGPHAITIIGIDVKNNNPKETIYIISETAEGEMFSFTGNELKNLFLNGGGGLITTINQISPVDATLDLEILFELEKRLKPSSAIKSLFNFYEKGDNVSIINIFNQFTINENNKYGEIEFTERLSQYISDVVGVKFKHFEIPLGFGKNIDDKKRFQAFVLRNVLSETPLLFSISRWLPNNPEIFITKIICIDGITVNDLSSNNTKYWVKDPDGKGIEWFFYGSRLKTFTAEYSLGIIGNEEIPF